MQDVTLAYDRFDPASEGLREALTSTGNGYFCTRGTAEWEDAGTVHYPGTYAHGGFNRETTILGGRPVLNEDLVNLPNWLVLKLRIEGEDAIRLDNVELVSYRHDYDIRRAMVRTRAAFPGPRGPRDDPAQPPVREHGRQPPGRHRVDPHPGELVGSRRGRLRARRAGDQPDGRPLPRAGGPPPRPRLAPHLRSADDRAQGADPAVEHLHRPGRPHPGVPRRRRRSRWSAASTRWRTTSSRSSPSTSPPGEPVRVEKLVALFTSHDNAITEPLAAAGRHVLRYPDFAAALAEHEGGVERAVGHLRRAAAARAPRPAAAAPPHRPRAAGVLAAHRPARRRRAGPRAQRRGLPRPRVLGRAVRLPVPQLPAARRSPGGCCCTATAG